MPLAMQRSPLWDDSHSPARDQPRTKVSSPLVASSPLARTPSKFAPYTGDIYTLEGVLGKGAFGLVSLMREVRSGKVVAMKTIERAQLRSDYLRRMVAREIRILQQLSSAEMRHPGIVALLEVIETRESIHLVLEYAAGGTLQQLVAARGRLSEEEARPLLWQLLDAVAHCHAQHVRSISGSAHAHCTCAVHAGCTWKLACGLHVHCP